MSFLYVVTSSPIHDVPNAGSSSLMSMPDLVLKRIRTGCLEMESISESVSMRYASEDSFVLNALEGCRSCHFA